ncbi:hypothetical protein E4U60_005195 [Claviceps pazoutovae]|uniref:Uncharacterized protein n=1 Tax=Claviceps pazoutovae TaxID=1649127 RepID=A0A9P7M7Y9_9HYPO|nr:hypothetical protein E4U60_005195 [Claviceps pazoutovae]
MSSPPPGPFWNYPVETVKDCITVRTVPDPVPTTSTPAAALPSSTQAAALSPTTPAAALPSSTPAAALRRPLPSSPPVVQVVPETVAPERAPRRRRRPRATSAELRRMLRNRDLAPEDDWTQMTNRFDIRRVQNRVAQRSYPTGMRRRIQDLEAQEEAERMRANDAMANPNGVPNTGMIDMRSLPPTYRQLGGQWPQPPLDWNSVPGLESPQPSSTSPPQATVRRQPRQVQSALTQSPFSPVWDEFYQSQETGIFDSYPVNEEGYSGLQSSSISQVTSSMSRTDAEHLRSLPPPVPTTWGSPASLFQASERAANLGTPTRAVNREAPANRPNPLGFRSLQSSPSVMGQMSLPQIPHGPVARNPLGFSSLQPSPSVLGQMRLPQVPHGPVSRNPLGFSSLQPSPSVLGQMRLPQVPNRPVVPWEQVVDPRLQSQVFSDTRPTAPWTGAGPSRANEENIESATRPMQGTGYGAFEDIATAYYAIQPPTSTSMSAEDLESRSKRLLEAIANAYYGTDAVPDMDRRAFLQHVLYTVTTMLTSHTTGSSSQLAFLWHDRGDAHDRETLEVLKRMVQREVRAMTEMQLDD